MTINQTLVNLVALSSQAFDIAQAADRLRRAIREARVEGKELTTDQREYLRHQVETLDSTIRAVKDRIETLQ